MDRNVPRPRKLKRAVPSSRDCCSSTTTEKAELDYAAPTRELNPPDFEANKTSDGGVRGDSTEPVAEELAEGGLRVRRLREEYPDVDIPNDLTPATFASRCDRYFNVFESSGGDAAKTTKRQLRNKREATAEDKVYRSDREFVKRHSHRKMIWFFRKVGLRHPAAVRTHLERVKHPEFELPNLQCVYPHPELAIACDDRLDDDAEDQYGGGGKKQSNNRTETTTTHMTYYQMYCATSSLVDRVKGMIGPPKENDTDYNKRVLTFIADIIGRLLWQNNRTHTVMFAKSDHYDRDCFILYSRQAEPTPFMTRSDSFFCRRHASEKYKYIGPQPDLTRSNSTRLSNDSSIYVVGCDPVEMWETFPYDYRATNNRSMKSLYDQIKKLDPSVVEHAFSAINAYVNGGKEYSPYVDVASKSSCDVLSVLLADLQTTATTDHSSYQDFVERFVTLGVLNVQALLKARLETSLYGGYCVGDATSPTSRRLSRIVLHNVRRRREVRELRTNRVHYFRNARDFLCSLSLVDDLFEDRTTVDDVGLQGEKNDRVVYFYDVIQPSEYDEELLDDVNGLVMYTWDEANTMIHESSHTVRQRLTADTLRTPPLDDPFYPASDMSAVDLAIDRILERAIKHSKKLKLLTPKEGSAKTPKKRKRSDGTGSLPPGLLIDADLNVDKNLLINAMSISGENRLRDGYVSPTRPDYETDHHVEHDGQHFHVKISVGGIDDETRRRGKGATEVDFGPRPCVLVDDKLTCVYTIDPQDTRQIKISHGSIVVDRNRPDYTKLRVTDRIVRVFVVQAIGADSYVVKPHVYFVFRNMPICEIDRFAVEEMFREANEYGFLPPGNEGGGGGSGIQGTTTTGSFVSTAVPVSEPTTARPKRPTSTHSLFFDWDFQQQQQYILPDSTDAAAGEYFDVNVLTTSDLDPGQCSI